MVLVITVTLVLILAAVSVKIAVNDDENGGVIQKSSEQRHEQFNMVNNLSEKINEAINNENGDDWGY